MAAVQLQRFVYFYFITKILNTVIFIFGFVLTLLYKVFNKCKVIYNSFINFIVLCLGCYSMGRSPSPRRRDRRDRERERDRESRRRPRSRSRSLERRRRSPERRRSPSPSRRRRSRSLSPGPSTSFVPKPKKTYSERPIITPADLEGKTPEEQEMLKVMGFCGFDTTKGKKVEDNVQGEVHVVLKRKYRQYMNRKGGFNRPLDFVA